MNTAKIVVTYDSEILQQIIAKFASERLGQQIGPSQIRLKGKGYLTRAEVTIPLQPNIENITLNFTKPAPDDAIAPDADGDLTMPDESEDDENDLDIIEIPEGFYYHEKYDRFYDANGMNANGMSGGFYAAWKPHCDMFPQSKYELTTGDKLPVDKYYFDVDMGFKGAFVHGNNRTILNSMPRPAWRAEVELFEQSEAEFDARYGQPEKIPEGVYYSEHSRCFRNIHAERKAPSFNKQWFPFKDRFPKSLTELKRQNDEK